MDMQVQTDFTQVLKVLPALRPLLVYIPLSTITLCRTIFWLLTTVFIFLQTTMMDKWSVGGAVNELGKRKCWALSISMKFYFVTVFMTSLMCGKISPACRISVQIWSFQKHRCIADVVPISNQSLLQADCVTFFSPMNTLDGGCWFGPRSHFNNNHLLLVQSKGMSWFGFDPDNKVQYLFSCPLGYPSNLLAVAEEYSSIDCGC